MVESAAVIGVLFARKRILTVLKDRRAFGENTAVDPVEAKIDYKRVLMLMEKGGFIRRTSEGKIYVTEEGRKAL